METQRLVSDYLKMRDWMVAKEAPVIEEMDAWVKRFTKERLTLADIAKFEGLRAERARLQTNLEDHENRLVAELLAEVGHVMSKR
jgi:hypothetical protein